MFNYFEANGIWFTPDNPENAVGGTFKFNEHGLQLTLLGSFREGWGPGGERYPLINGTIESSPYGSIISLIDNFSQGSSFNSVGVTSERIRCHKAAIGDFHLSLEPTECDALELAYTHLTEWGGYGGLEYNRAESQAGLYSVTYQRPADVVGKFGSNSILLKSTFRMTSGAHSATLTDEYRLLIQPIGLLDNQEIGINHVRMFQNLMTFACDRPNSIDRVVYHSPKSEHHSSPKINVIFDQIYKHEKAEKKAHPAEMLFCYDDIKTSGMEIFEKWFDFSVLHSEFVTVYFAYLYQPPKYLEDKFARVLASFTLLCTGLGKSSDNINHCLVEINAVLQNHFPGTATDLLTYLVPNEADLAMPFVLRQMLEENSLVMSKIIKDFSAFVQSVTDTLHFVNKRAVGARPSLDSTGMVWCIEKINVLIKIIVLTELGFKEAIIESLFDRNPTFVHLRTI